MPDAPTLSVLIRNREGVLFNEKVIFLSSLNDRGKFDVLPGHANFISIIKEKVTLKLLDGSIRDIPVDNGVLRVVNDLAEIYLGVKK